MNFIEAIILGIVQGAAEFLPISSSGHLIIFQNWLGLDTEGTSYLAFDVLLHIGTLVSVLFIFWKDVLGLIIAFFKMLFDLVTTGKLNLEKSEYRKMTIMLIIAAVPLVIAAFFEKYLHHFPLWLVGIMLLMTGVILLLTSKIKSNNKGLKESKFRDALVVGVSQLIAVIPGLSRSGTTIFAGCAMGLSKEFAVRFSFLLSMIAILGATALSLDDMSGGVVSTFGWQALAGTITAALVGIIAIKWLINLVSKGKLSYLAWYCFAMGLVAIIF
ncbi:MAG: undecaprenyl-diphosphate phosphatase [Oscillospiraceae bacterium]|nr:undecaprenyl-diphosphate phosphatase [Oscillospiraceae bacterium]